MKVFLLQTGFLQKKKKGLLQPQQRVGANESTVCNDSRPIRRTVHPDYLSLSEETRVCFSCHLGHKGDVAALGCYHCCLPLVGHMQYYLMNGPYALQFFELLAAYIIYHLLIIS